ncbi:MAG: hypothetical protein QNJ02_07225 [Desulfobacterales bacterium]|nr:hypothetical protein [Desulfobacterales bacterium]
MIAICVESSHAMGMGHLFRGIHLARCLSLHGRDNLILVNAHAPSIRQLKQYGLPFQVVPLEEDFNNWETRVIEENAIDIWMNDRLDTTKNHAARVKANKVALVTFDDAGTGAALSDLHFAPLAGCRSIRLEGSHLLTGLDYLILDPGLGAHRRQRTQANRLLVSLGGSDTHGVVVRLVGILKQLGIKATIHIGPAFKHGEELAQIIDSQFKMMASAPSMGAVYTDHDLAVTGGGVTPFEAAATGLPSVVIANEDFEIPTGQFLQTRGLALFAGHHESLGTEKIAAALRIAHENQTAMSATCLQAVPTDGAENVYDAICRYL